MRNDQPRVHAGFGARLGADVIDGVIGSAIAFAVWLLVDRALLGSRTGLMEDERPLLVADAAAIAWFLWIKVVAADGGPTGFWRALGRNVFAAFISGPIFYLGFLWVLWDADKQAWHDKLFRTYVVSD